MASYFQISLWQNSDGHVTSQAVSNRWQNMEFDSDKGHAWTTSKTTHNGRDFHASSQCLKLSSCCWVCSHSSCSSDTAALLACDHLLATGSGLPQDEYKNWLWSHKCIQRYLASFVPRPPPFFVLQFAFSVIHGSGRHSETQTEDQKWRRPGNEASTTIVCSVPC